MQGQPPAHPQHRHDGDTASTVVPNKPQWHQTNANPSGLPAQVCFRWLQTPGWLGGPQKGDSGTKDGHGAMLQPGTRVPSRCRCQLPGKAGPWRTAAKQGDSPSAQPLGTSSARPEMSRSRLSLQARDQPGRNLHATCGRFPMAAGEQCSPSPASRGGSDPKTCPAAGHGSPRGCSPNALLTALTYQAGD